MPLAAVDSSGSKFEAVDAPVVAQRNTYLLWLAGSQRKEDEPYGPAQGFDAWKGAGTRTAFRMQFQHEAGSMKEVKNAVDGPITARNKSINISAVISQSVWNRD